MAEDDRSYLKICNEVDVHGRLCSGIRHPNLVAMLSAFESDDGDICMLLEYCSNGNLSDFVEKLDGCALGEPEAARFLKQLLNAVDYMHTVHEIIHRDIKPGNVLLSNNYTVKLADFGLACTLEESKRRLSVCGTPNFVSPEIIQYRGHSFASDYWALACTFYFMLCGATPFQTNNIRGTYSKICRSEFSYPENFSGCYKSKDFIERLVEFFAPSSLLKHNFRVLIVEPKQRMTMHEMIAHPLFHLVRRSSMGNLFTDRFVVFSIFMLIPPLPFSNGNLVETPIKPLSKCQSMLDFNNNRSQTDPLLATQAMFCRALQGVLNQTDSLGYGMVISNNFLPDTYVAKWVDYTNKFGFGVMLRNGVRSIVFNDDSVLSTIDGEQFIYHPVKTKRSCMIWDSYSSPNSAIQSKINTARYVRNYMDQELNTSVPMASLSASHSTQQPLFQEEADEFLAMDTCRNAYVMDIMKCDSAIVFLISDGSMQVGR